MNDRRDPARDELRRLVDRLSDVGVREVLDFVRRLEAGADGEPSAAQAALVCFDDARWPDGRRIALRELQRPDALATADGFHCFAMMAGWYALGGELNLAREMVAELAAHPEVDRWRDGVEGVYLRIAECLIALDADDTGSALAALDRIGRHGIAGEYWPVISMIVGRIGSVRRDPVAAEAEMNALLADGVRPPTTPYLRALFDSVRGLLLTQMGRPGASLELMRTLPATVPEVVTEIARAFLELGQPERAEQALAALGETTTPVVVRTRLDQLILRSLAAERMGDPLLAERYRDRAAALGRVHGMTARTRHIPTERPTRITGLSRAELAVLHRLAAGESRQTIADRLHVSHDTVKSHLRSIYRKLGVNARADALRVAREYWLLDA